MASTRRIKVHAMRGHTRVRSSDGRFFVTDDGKGLVRSRSSVTRVAQTVPNPAAAPALRKIRYTHSGLWADTPPEIPAAASPSSSTPNPEVWALAQEAMRRFREHGLTTPDTDSFKFIRTIVDLHELTASLPLVCPDAEASAQLQNSMRLWLSKFPLKHSLDQLLNVVTAEEPQESDQERKTTSLPEVVLDSPTGPVSYRLPFSLDETYGPSEVGEILSPTGTPNRTAAKNRRDKSELLGVEVGHRYRYPKFQLDVAKHCIRPVVAYANVQLDSAQDPWGVLSWWYSIDSALGDRRPVELVAAGELTTEHVDLTVGVDGRGMS